VLTIFNILAMALIGSDLMTPAFFQSSAAIVVVALTARYLIAHRARHHPDLVVALVATTATVALAVVGIREPSMAVFVAAFLLVVPLAVVMLIPWRTATHFGFLLIHAAVAVPAYLIMASLSVTSHLELLAVCATTIGMSMIGKLLASHEDRRTFMLRRTLVTRRAQLTAANQALAASLRHDPLTGSRNRLRLGEDLVAVRSELARDGLPWGLLAVDLDRFKSINDDFGHATGDAVLGAAVQAMKSALRPGDGIYRIGGEEFVVLLARLPAARAMAIAERLRHSVEDLAIANPSSRPSGVLTVSIGLTVLDADALSVDDDGWLARADRALYRAKDEGRNRIVAAGTPAPPRVRTDAGQSSRAAVRRRAVIAAA
jgi:diguanylate cyclase (GGDEF)-like protein